MAQASTAAHCLPLHSRGFHIPPIRQVVRQTPTILSRKPTRKPHHHGKPFSCRVSAGPCQQQGKCFSTAIGGERRFPFRSSPQGMNPFPQSPYTLRHRTLRGGTIHPPPYRRTSLPRFQHEGKEGERHRRVPLISNLAVSPDTKMPHHTFPLLESRFTLGNDNPISAYVLLLLILQSKTLSLERAHHSTRWKTTFFCAMSWF